MPNEIETAPASAPPPSAPPINIASGEGTSDESSGSGAAPMGAEPRPQSPLMWLGILLLLGVGLPFVPIPNIWVAGIGALALAAFYVFVIVRFASDATRVRWPVAKHIALLVGALALWWVFDTYVTRQAGAPLGEMMQAARAMNQAPPKPDASLLFALFLTRTLTDIFLLSAAVLGGALVARLITEPNMLAPICGVIAIIDVWGVLFGGIVAQMLEKAPTTAARAMASLPTIGAATGVRPDLQIPLPDIGAGDYLFLGLLFAAMHAHRMNVRGALRWIIPLIIVALWGITLGLPAMPGLLFIGLGAAIPNRAWFRFSRDEKFALLWAGGFVIILAIGLGFAAPSIIGALQGIEPQR